MNKKILSMLLALCLMGGVMPNTAWAVTWQETTQDNNGVAITTKTTEVTTAVGLNEAFNEIDNTNANTTWVIKLANDITIDSTLNITKTVTLDLSGHVLSLAPGKTGSVIKVTNKCTLTIKDSNPNRTHKFSKDSSGLWKLDETNGTETVTGGIITGGKSADYGGGIHIDTASLTMIGGSIVGCQAQQYGGGMGSGFSSGNVGDYTANLTMTGAKIIGCLSQKGGGGLDAGGIQTNQDTLTKIELTDVSISSCNSDRNVSLHIPHDKISVKIQNGSFDGAVEIVGKKDSEGISGASFSGDVVSQVKILGGTFAGKVESSNAISGGTFNNFVRSYGTISGGAFNNFVRSYGTISGGTFNGITLAVNEGVISGGAFHITVINSGTINNGTFHENVENEKKHTITNGTFNGVVINKGTISGGTFNESVTDIYNIGTVKGGMFYAKKGTLDYNYSIFAGRGKIDGKTVDYKINDEYYAKQVLQSGKATEPTKPAAAGYDTFEGWYSDTGFTKKYDYNTEVRDDITLYGKQKPLNYTITYNAIEDCSFVNGANPISYTVESENITLNAPTKVGYVFTGWTTTNITEPQKDVTITKGSIGNRTYTANWTECTEHRYSSPRDSTCDLCGHVRRVSGNGSSKQYPTVVAPTNGSITLSSSGRIATITPNEGYEIAKVLLNGVDKGRVSELTDLRTGDKIEVIFEKIDKGELDFADVDVAAYYYDAVRWAATNGITTGTHENLFSPNKECTRAEIVTFLWRAAGSPVVNYAMGMDDVPKDAYYAEAVRWALSEGIAAGTGDDTFSPNSACTRAQAVTFLARAENGAQSSADSAQAGDRNADDVSTGGSPFSDVAAGSYYADPVAWAVENGITDGIGGGLFAPDDGCTRAQIVTFLYRALAK